jgi:hypothetical protein
MGVVLMSKRELNRIDVLARLDGGRLTTSAAADLMRLTTRQTHRLLKRYRDGGAPAIANRRRGRPSNNRGEGQLERRVTRQGNRSRPQRCHRRVQGGV